MNAKKLTWLVAAALLLAVLVWLSEGGSGREGGPAARQLLGTVNGEDVARIKLQQGSKIVDLELREAEWVVPARNGYRADSNKVRALLLKLFDLSVNQRVTDLPESFEELGVADDSHTKGFGRVALLDDGGKELGALALGGQRTARPRADGAGAGNGQFVRRVGENDTYLINQLLTLVVEPKDWLNSELVNVGQSRVRQVRQFKIEAGQETPLFTITRRSPYRAGDVPQYDLEGAAGAELQDTVLTQVASGLENARLQDVLSAEEAKETVFDRRTEYATQSGLVYSVFSAAEANGRNLVKLEVRFDPELGRQIEAEAAAEAAAQSAAAASSAQSEGASSSSSAPAAPSKPQIATAAEAATLTAGYTPWVYDVAQFQAERFRRSREDLIKPPPAEMTPDEANQSLAE